MAEIVKLNVGGSIYTTTRSTLTRYPNSMLGAMFSGRMQTTQDEHDNYWIDGNGPIFCYVLDFLRRSHLLVPDDFAEFDLLEKEADFYQIPELILAIKRSRAMKHGHGNLYREARYVAVEYYQQDDEHHPLFDPDDRDDTLNIYGPKDILEQIKSTLDNYQRSDSGSTVQFIADCYMKIHPYNRIALPQHTLMLMLFNLGLKLCPTPQYAEWPEKMHYDVLIPDIERHWFMQEQHTL